MQHCCFCSHCLKINTFSMYTKNFPLKIEMKDEIFFTNLSNARIRLDKFSLILTRQTNKNVHTHATFTVMPFY